MNLDAKFESVDLTDGDQKKLVLPVLVMMREQYEV
jgi:hypothetical protein